MIRPSLLLALMAVTSALGQAPVSPTPTAPDAPIDFTKVIAETEAKAKLPPETVAIIAKFERLRQEFEERKIEIARAALARFENASASEGGAIQFYNDCVALATSAGRGAAFSAAQPPNTAERAAKAKQEDRDRRSNGKGNSRNSKAQDQRDDQNDETEIPGRGAFLQLQLQFLVFSMQAVETKDPGVVVGKLRDFATRAVNLARTYGTAPTPDPNRSVPVGSGSDKAMQAAEKAEQLAQRQRQAVLRLANQGVMGSVFADAYNLSTFFKPLSGWPGSPMNLEMVYSGQVLPYYREVKTDSLGAGWDEYIALKAAVERITMDEATYSYWMATELKNLQWAKWKDMLFTGANRALAADELAKLAHDSVNFSNIAHWTTEVQKIRDSLEKGETPTELGPGQQKAAEKAAAAAAQAAEEAGLPPQTQTPP